MQGVQRRSLGTRERRRSRSALAVAFAALIGMGGGATVAVAAEPMESGDEPVSLVAMHGSSPDFIALVPLAAWDILAERGIEVEQRYAEDAATAIQAMAQGDVQIGTNIGVNVGVPAVNAGAEIVDVIATQRPTWALAVRPEIESFEDLEGASLAVHGEASFTRAVAEWYGEQEGFEYEQLIIPGSEVRAEALAQGEIDASVIDLPDVILLSHVYPGEFEVLVTIGETFPELIEQDIWFDANWVAENRDLAVEVVAALLEGIRRLRTDADYALELATEHLPDVDPAVLEDTIAEYQARDIWPADGLLTPERAQETMDFFFSVGELEVDPSTIELEDYFDFSLLDDALAIVGEEASGTTATGSTTGGETTTPSESTQGLR
jgi:ABC-type nitrate/sulfonate/bicarbonate transport system substrate-binding protein